MKTLLAIALAVAALTIGTATIAPISSTAVAGRGGPADAWSGRVPTEATQSANVSRSVSCNRHASRSLNRRAGGSPSIMEVRCGDR